MIDSSISLFNTIRRFILSLEKQEVFGWLLDTLSDLDISVSSKIDFFGYKLNSENSNYVSQLLKTLCYNPTSRLCDYLLDHCDIWPHLFQIDDHIISSWFDHFSFDSKSTKGALSLERYAFTNREWFWDKYMVWKDGNYRSPVVVSKAKQNLMYLDVLATVKRIIDQKLDDFWSSTFWKESIDDNCTLIKDNADFFSIELSKRIHRKSRLVDVINTYIADKSVKFLSSSVLYNIDIEDFIKRVPRLNLDQQSLGSQLLYILDSNNMDDVLVLNSLMEGNRDKTLRYLLDNQVFCKELQGIIGSLNLSEKDFIPYLSNLRDELYMSNKSLKKLNLSEVQAILLKTFTLQAVLNNAKLTREISEAMFTFLNITYDPIEVSKKRKSKTKQSNRFIGWKITYDYSKSANTKKRKHSHSDMLVLEEVPKYIASFLEMEVINKQCE